MIASTNSSILRWFFSRSRRTWSRPADCSACSSVQVALKAAQNSARRLQQTLRQREQRRRPLFRPPIRSQFAACLENAVLEAPYIPIGHHYSFGAMMVSEWQFGAAVRREPFKCPSCRAKVYLTLDEVAVGGNAPCTFCTSGLIPIEAEKRLEALRLLAERLNRPDGQ